MFKFLAKIFGFSKPKPTPNMDIKPCPFCNSRCCHPSRTKFGMDSVVSASYWMWQVGCEACGGKGPAVESDLCAEDSWDERPVRKAVELQRRTKALSCPFCETGGDAWIYGYKGRYYVSCRDCYAESAEGQTREEAAANWNGLDVSVKSDTVKA